jgi:carboxymethylenebutenolidase
MEATMGEWLSIGPQGRQAYLATPKSGGGPGVLVLHAWWGLTSVFTHVCDQLAENGFVALAPGLYASGASTDSIEEAEKLGAH